MRWTSQRMLQLKLPFVLVAHPEGIFCEHEPLMVCRTLLQRLDAGVMARWQSNLCLTAH